MFEFIPDGLVVELIDLGKLLLIITQVGTAIKKAFSNSDKGSIKFRVKKASANVDKIDKM